MRYFFLCFCIVFICTCPKLISYQKGVNDCGLCGSVEAGLGVTFEYQGCRFTLWSIVYSATYPCPEKFDIEVEELECLDGSSCYTGSLENVLNYGQKMILSAVDNWYGLNDYDIIGIHMPDCWRLISALNGIDTIRPCTYEYNNCEESNLTIYHSTNDILVTQQTYTYQNINCQNDCMLLCNSLIMPIDVELGVTYCNDDCYWKLNGNKPVLGEFIGSINPADFIIKTNNTEKFRITSTGKVIINKKPNYPNDDALLSIGGKGVARELVILPPVYSPAKWVWPDFVFNENYQPIPFDELKNFIKKEKHLPDMPSAEEINKSGLNLQEIQTKLLQKIEELTIYTINLNKQNKLLKLRIEKLNKSKELKINENER